MLINGSKPFRSAIELKCQNVSEHIKMWYVLIFNLNKASGENEKIPSTNSLENSSRDRARLEKFRWKITQTCETLWHLSASRCDTDEKLIVYIFIVI